MTAPSRLLIAGASLVDGAGGTAPADVLVDEGRIAAIGALSAEESGSQKVIEARGRLLLPGGVDPHVHFLTPSDGTRTCDTFASGTTAAAFGGTTTALQFCVQDPGEPLPRTVARWQAMLGAERPRVDVGFHLMITDLSDPARFEELGVLPEAGVTSFKVFMSGANGISGGDLFRVMQVAREAGARVMIHAEDGASIDVMVGQALEAGRTLPIEHARTRPAPTESIAVHRAIEYARMTGAEVYFVHLSSAAALAHVRAARSEGLPVDGETCPHYFLFDETILDGPFEETAPFLFTPPPRGERDHAAIWAALEDGTLSTVASDHGGYCRHEKTGAPDFAHVPQGIIGIETRLAFLHHFGVRAGRLSLARMVELTATAPARLFGLSQRKGSISVGLDADLVIFDPELEQVVSRATHHSAHDSNPYEGVAVVGQVTHTLVRGELVVDDRRPVEPAPPGRFLPR